MEKTKIGVVSLGCDKNRYDTEVMLANLQQGGYQITHDASQADVIIVNTCAFLESARKEAIETALEMAGYKQNGNCKKVIVTGCLGQMFGQDLLDGLDEVDSIAGTNNYDDICQIVQNALQGQRALYHTPNDRRITFGTRILTTASHTAYIKIADGCDNYCTYCLIPFIRGRFRSVEMDKVVQQAEQLASQGVKELILVAQDTTRYGKDLYGQPQIVQLVQRLSQIQGIVWIRLLYCYPELLTDQLIEEIATNDKVVKYVDVPLQHVNDDILKRMNRRSSSNGIRALFDKLKQKNIAIRSTFICGFPGETKQTVQEVEDFLHTYPMRNVGFFPYSREEGTASAKFDNQVPTRTKNSYVKRLYDTQYKVADAQNKALVGQALDCIVDEQSDFDGQYYTYVGRAYFMTPEIDGCVFITSAKQLQKGSFVKVKITGVMQYDLTGEVVL